MFADNMMYRAKAAGKDQVAIPTTDDVVEIFRDLSQKSQMVMAAIEDKRVIPYFQPILMSRASGLPPTKSCRASTWPGR